MMKKIMNVRVAAVALAASALIAAPAMADPARGSIAQLETRLGATGLSIQIGHNAPTGRHGRYRANQWGQSLRQERQLRRNAVQACRAAISRTAWRAGFHDVDFDDDRRIQQIGPNGFRIRFDDVEFENRRRIAFTCAQSRPADDVGSRLSVPLGQRHRLGELLV